MPDPAPFLAAIRASPDDDAPRLVYADWLDDHGQPERAEFIRVQIELARRESPDLRAREAELLERHHDEFANRLANPHFRFCFKRGFIVALGHTGVFANIERRRERGRRPHLDLDPLPMARVIRFRLDGWAEEVSDRFPLDRAPHMLREGGPKRFHRYMFHVHRTPPSLHLTSPSSEAEIRGELKGTRLLLDYSGGKDRGAERIRFNHVPFSGFDSFSPSPPDAAPPV